MNAVGVVEESIIAMRLTAIGGAAAARQQIF